MCSEYRRSGDRNRDEQFKNGAKALSRQAQSECNQIAMRASSSRGRQEMAVDALDDFLSAQLDNFATRIRLAAAPTPDYAAAVQQLQHRIAALDAHNSKLATQCIRLATVLPPREPQFRDRFAWQNGSPPPLVAGFSHYRALQPSGIGGLSPRFPRQPKDPSPSEMQASSEASEQLRKQLEKALSMHGELMAHVKKAAEEDAARRAEAEADRLARAREAYAEMRDEQRREEQRRQHERLEEESAHATLMAEARALEVRALETARGPLMTSDDL